ncbi:helicase C-terminal domain-containing protein [candidate division KSB1 bacterium]
MTKLHSYISQSSAEYMRNEIEETGGREVFFCGYTDENGIINDVSVLSRGNEFSVPAVIDFLSHDNVVIHNHPSGTLEPSFNDINIASYLANQGIGVYIVDNDVSDIYVVVERYKKEKKKQLDLKALKTILKPGGEVSQKLKNYEFRRGQLKMMENIIEAFNTDKIQIIEAGTGIGKTLAYLIPAIYWSLENKERCIVSTNTINLQEQIINKDIPFLKEVLDADFKASLIKGRNNYICLRKVETEEREMPALITIKEKEELKLLIKWARETASGDKSELSFIPKSENWEKVCCEADTCIRLKCPYYEKCFLLKSRREAADSNILIINHHLLFADLYIRSKTGQFSNLAVLPPYSRIIIDEAHHTEDVATNYFSLEVSRGGIIRTLGRIYSERKTGESYGLLSILRTKLILRNKGKLKNNISEIISKIEQTLIPQKIELTSHAEDIFMLIAKLSQSFDNNEFENKKIRLNDNVINSKLWKERIIPEISEFCKSLKTFAKSLKDLKESIENLTHKVYKEFEDRLIELNSKYGRVKELIEKLQKIFNTDEPERVKWIETEKLTYTDRVAVLSAPLNISSDLEETFFKHTKTIILTSATLTVNNNFEFLKNRIGLSNISPNRCSESIIQSSFDYQTQVMIGIPKDIPLPAHQDFAENVNKLIYRSLSLSKGRAFILFTSYKMLNDLHQKLEEPLLKNLNIVSLKQGDYSRSYLLDNFRSDISSVLFGTDSFWEGVDVEGSSLESIIIVKLPFRVPTEPILEARTENIEKKGGNSFIQYSLPMAVIKFKQGFGRLIRRKTDRGFILILDKRIIEKFYGKIFLNSLPKCRVTTGTANDVFNDLKKFHKLNSG